MPQTYSTASANGLAPVPVAVLLPPPARRHGDSTTDHLPDWYGVAPRDAAGLVARYSQPGDLVIELDDHPTITHAARHLGRRPAPAITTGDGLALPTPASARRPRQAPSAGLILAALPRHCLDRCDLAATSAVTQTWRMWLRPGGYLLTALRPPSADTSRPEPVSHRATVIAAARAAGFTWQQEFLVLTAPPPEYEPRALPDTATTVPSALVDGRHQPAHIKVLAFRHEAGGRDA
jgi:hypothetical protein